MRELVDVFVYESGVIVQQHFALEMPYAQQLARLHAREYGRVAKIFGDGGLYEIYGA